MSRPQAEDMMEGVTHYTNKGFPVQIIKYTDKNHVLVKSTTTGWEGTVRSDKLRISGVKDPYYPSVYGVGYMGEGCYLSSTNGSMTPSYDRWRSMLGRCYDTEHIAYPRYGVKGVYVASEWHNFQVFAKWYDESCQALGIPLKNDYHIDKDKNHEGEETKYYGTDTCCLITSEENVQLAHAKTYQFRDKDGVIHSGTNISEFARIHGLDQSNLSKLQRGTIKKHKGWTLP